MKCSFCNSTNLIKQKIDFPLFNHFNNKLIKIKNAYQVYECKICNLLQKKNLNKLYKKLFNKNYQKQRVLPHVLEIEKRGGRGVPIYELNLKRIFSKNSTVLDYGSTNYFAAKNFLENNKKIKNKQIYFYDRYLKIKNNIIYNVGSNKIILLKKMSKINFDYILMQNCLMYEKNLKKFTINFCSFVNKNTTIEVIVPSIENKFQFSYGDNYNYFTEFFLQFIFFKKNFLAIKKENSNLRYSHTYIYKFRNKKNTKLNMKSFTKKVYLTSLVSFLLRHKNKIQNYFDNYKDKSEIAIFGSRSNAFFVYYVIKYYFKKIYLLDEKKNFSHKILKRFNIISPNSKAVNKKIPVILNYGADNIFYKKKLIKNNYKNFICF